MSTMATKLLILIAVFATVFGGCGTDSKNPYGMPGVDPMRADAAGSPPGTGGSNTGAGGAGGVGGSGAPGGSGGSVSPGGTGGASTPVDAGATSDRAAGPDTPGGVGPAPGKAPIPARLVVLGDSIVACSNVGNENGASCSVKKLYDYLKATYAPGMTYENDAVGGAVTDDVADRQLRGVNTGPGHTLVLIYIGGNNLARYLFAGDAVAERGYNTDLPGIKANWETIFGFFQDKTKFPDGTTVIMNNQYNPFDGCTAPPYNLSARKFQLLGMFNMELAGIAAAKGAHLTDQHTPYLGHGHHYNVRMCPHYKDNSAPWMDDLIHPNAAGHENLFQQWKAIVDKLYR